MEFGFWGVKMIPDQIIIAFTVCVIHVGCKTCSYKMLCLLLQVEGGHCLWTFSLERFLLFSPCIALYQPSILVEIASKYIYCSPHTNVTHWHTLACCHTHYFGDYHMSGHRIICCCCKEPNKNGWGKSAHTMALLRNHNLAFDMTSDSVLSS